LGLGLGLRFKTQIFFESDVGGRDVSLDIDTSRRKTDTISLDFISLLFRVSISITKRSSFFHFVDYDLNRDRIEIQNTGDFN
jgi:hypothetical protein